MNVLEFGCITDFKLKNNIDTPNTKAILFHGTALNEMIDKKSAKYNRMTQSKNCGVCANILFPALLL